MAYLLQLYCQENSLKCRFHNKLLIDDIHIDNWKTRVRSGGNRLKKEANAKKAVDLRRGMYCSKLFARGNVAFYTNQDFLFYIDRYHFNGPSSSESKEPRFRSLEIEADAVLYIQNLASAAGNPGWSCTRPKLVCWWWLRSKQPIQLLGLRKVFLYNQISCIHRTYVIVEWSTSCHLIAQLVIAKSHTLFFFLWGLAFRTICNHSCLG